MLPTPLTARKTRSTTDLPGKTEGPAHNTRSRSNSRRAEDQVSLPGSYQESDVDPEETPVPRARAKGKEKQGPAFTSIDLSKHPIFQGTSSDPLPVVNNLEGLVRLLSTTKDGPKWYNFIRDMIAYDISIFDHYQQIESENAKLKNKTERYKDNFKEYEDRHKAISDQLLESEERHSNTELLLQHARQRIDKLNERLVQLQSHEQEQENDSPEPVTFVKAANSGIQSRQPETFPKRPTSEQITNPAPPALLQSIAFPTQIKWKAQGSDPTEKLTGTDKQAYGPWAYSVKEKLDIDAPLYPTERRKVNYIIRQLKEPIFQFMVTWTETNEDGTSKSLLQEIEHYMGIHNQAADARKTLYEMIMGENETVDELYHKMHQLWKLAKVPEAERIDQFITSLRPYLSNSITNIRFTTVREVVDEVRLTETRKKMINNKYARNNLRNNASNNASNRTNQNSQNQNNNNKPRNSTAFTENPNEKLIPCAKKPTGWVGTWYEPEEHPKKLEDNEKWDLTKQGRCWRCRGSGHKAGDEVNGKQLCPTRKERKVNVQRVENLESEEEKA